MKREQLLSLIEQYRAGLDAELMLLHRLQALAIEQRRDPRLARSPTFTPPLTIATAC